MGKKYNKFDTRNESDAVVHDLGNRKKFHPKDLCNLTPQTGNQEHFFDLFYTGKPIISMIGPAGTGKSFLSLYAALTEVLDEATEYDKVVIIRSAVETRKQGFLPGTQDEKDAPFERPYIDAVSKILPAFNDGYKHLKSLGYLEFETTAHLRGNTFDRTIILVDEIQNMDYEELSTVITRCGEYSRIVLMGDIKQNDLARFKQDSGFDKLQRVFRNMEERMIGKVRFEIADVVRSGLVREFLIADYHTE